MIQSFKNNFTHIFLIKKPRSSARCVIEKELLVVSNQYTRMFNEKPLQ